MKPWPPPDEAIDYVAQLVIELLNDGLRSVSLHDIARRAFWLAAGADVPAEDVERFNKFIEQIQDKCFEIGERVAWLSPYHLMTICETDPSDPNRERGVGYEVNAIFTAPAGQPSKQLDLAAGEEMIARSKRKPN
jgi:hypothetical protein